MLRSTKMLVMLAVIASIALALPCAAVTWDVSADYSSTSAIGDWSYGWAPYAAEPYQNYTFNPMQGFNPNMWSAMGWVRITTTTNYPALYYNPTASTLSIQYGILPPSKVMMQTSTDLSKNIVRWTSPGSGTYNINAKFAINVTSPNYQTARVAIILNRSTHLMDGVFTSTSATDYSFNGPVTLNVNDTIDFVLGDTNGQNRDNTILEAVISSTDEPGTVSGSVTAQTGGMKLAGAKVEVVGGVRYDIADENGNFSLELLPGTFTLKASKPGYASKTISGVVVSSGSNTSQSFQLSTTGFTGVVKTPGNEPIRNAKVEVVGGTDYAVTDNNGVYILPLPAGTYNLRASKPKFTTQDINGVTVAGSGTTTQDFTIELPTGATWVASTDWIWADAIRNPQLSDWGYGYAAVAATFTGYSYIPSTLSLPLSGLAQWAGDSTTININWSTTNQNTLPGGTIPAGKLAQYGSTTSNSIIRWTAPVSGFYSFSAKWTKLHNSTSGSPDCWVIRNGTEILYQGQATPSGEVPVCASAAALNAGDTLDFALGRSTGAFDNRILDATIMVVSTGVTGSVIDSDGNPIAGALLEVVSRTEKTVSDVNGNYALPVATTGDVTIKVSKPGYETITQVVNLPSDSLATANFILETSGIFSGQVIGHPAAGIPIDIPLGGATLKSSDGVYSITTAADGSFSAPVTSGTYTFRVYKYGYLAKNITVTIGSEGTSQNIELDAGWDLGGDFAVSTNPSGVWTYAYDNGTAVVPMTQTYANWPTPQCDTWRSALSDPGYVPCFVGNTSLTLQPKQGRFRAEVEPWKVVTHPGYQYSTGVTGQKSVARFTAPVGGYFDVDITWSGRTDHDSATVDGTSSQVAFFKNGSEVTSGRLDGYIGTSTQGYTDSFGTQPVISYSTVGELAAGDVLDVVVSGDNSGWTGVDFTVASVSGDVFGYIYGKVTSDGPGNPPLNEVVINAAGGCDPYTVVTDESGAYMLPVTAGTYDIDATKGGYTTGTAEAIVVTAGSAIEQNFILEFGGVWDAAVDFSSINNPNGQWSYGWTSISSNRMEFNLYDQYRGVSGGDYLNYNFWTTDNGVGWSGGIRRNPGTPDTWTMSIFADPFGTGTQETWYSEGGQLVMFPGGKSSSGTYDKLAVLRWTAPQQMVVNVDATWTSQWVPGYRWSGSHQYALNAAVVKNGSVISAPILGGFIGKYANHYTDSTSVKGWLPKEKFATAISVNAGDTLDFSFTGNNMQQFLLGLDLKISEMTDPYTYATSIAEIKDIPITEPRTTVFMTTPVQLACGSGDTLPGTFDRRYGNPPVSEEHFYVQTDDRTQCLKLVVAGALPDISVAHKITFTGKVDIDANGEKFVRVTSIDSSTTSAAPAPLGKTGKALTNTGTLVKVWGKITAVEPNPYVEMWQHSSGTWYKDYAWASITVNDGSQAVKVLMNVQGIKLSDFDSWVTDLEVGDYIGVTGIATTTDGTDVVIIPRDGTDIVTYHDITPE